MGSLIYFVLKVEGENILKKDYRIVEGFNDYMVTYDGEVWSYKDKFKCRKGLKQLKVKYDKKGYGYIDLVDGVKKKRFAIHRLVAYYFCNGYFDGAVVNHIDANTRNNVYTNLEWVTQKDNIHKSYKTSGKDQTRNFCIYYIEYPCGKKSENLKTQKEVREYMLKHKLPIKVSMLIKHREVKGYKLHKL